MDKNLLPIWVWFFGFVVMFIGNSGTGPNGGDAFVVLGLMILALGWLVGAWVTYQLSDTTGESPISIEYVVPEKSSRLLALCSITLIPLIGLLKLLFLLPHIIILFFFGLAFFLLSIAGILCSLFGTYPESIRNFLWNVAKWRWRVTAYYLCLCDSYPPLTTASENYPTEIRVDNREGNSRSTLLTLYGTIFQGKIILLLPHYIIIIFYAILAAIASFLGPIVVLLLGRYPESWMGFIVKVRQQRSRISAYAICLTEAFPPVIPSDGLDAGPANSS